MIGAVGLADRDTAQASGFAVIARIRHGVCAVVQILACDELTVTEGADGNLSISAADADSFYFGFYSDVIAANGREPYDQHGAAYAPLSYSQLRIEQIAGYGMVLIQGESRRRSVYTSVNPNGVTEVFGRVDDVACLRDVILEIARRAGVPRHAMPALPLQNRLISAAFA